MYGKVIREERKKRGLSQGELAALIGFKSASAIGMIEREEREINLETLKRISNILGVSVDYLLGHNDKSHEAIINKYYKLGQTIKTFREEKNLNSDEFSKLCSVNIDYIIRLEKGLAPNDFLPKSEPTLTTLKRIANVLNVSTDSWLVDSEFYKDKNDFSNHEAALDLIIALKEYLNENKGLLKYRLPTFLEDYGYDYISDNFDFDNAINFYFNELVDYDINEVSNEIEKLNLIYSIDSSKIIFSNKDKNASQKLYKDNGSISSIITNDQITDVKEAMELILKQPGLMLNGEILSDKTKIAIANAINMGLAWADQEIKKEKKEKEKN